MPENRIFAAILIAASIYLGADRIAGALQTVTVNMKSTFLFAAEDKGSDDGTP